MRICTVIPIQVEWRIIWSRYLYNVGTLYYVVLYVRTSP